MRSRVGGCGDQRAASLGPPLLLPSLPPLPSQPLGSRVRGQRASCGRACSGSRKGGAPEPQQEKASPPAAARPVRPRPGPHVGSPAHCWPPSPAVEVDLGAPSTSVLGLATTKAPVPTPRGSPAQRSAGRRRVTSVLPTARFSANRLSHSSDPRVATPPQHARTHLTHTTHAALCLAPGWRLCPRAHTPCAVQWLC